MHIRNRLFLLKAEHIPRLSPEARRRLQDHHPLLIRIKHRSVPDKVTLLSLDELGSLEQLPAEVKEGSDDLHGVVGEEVLGVEWRQRGVSIGVDNDDLQDEGDPGAVGLEVTVVGHLLAVDALHLASAVVKEEGDAHGDVVHDASARDEGEQDAQSLGRAAVELQEGQEREEHGDGKAVDGHAVLSRLAEESRGTSLEGETVERTGGAICVCVAGRVDGREQQRIHNMGENIDTHVLHGNDIGGSGGSRAVAVTEVHRHELGVLVVQHDTACQGSTNEEQSEAEVDGFEGRLDVPAGVLGLGSNHGDVVGAHNVEGCGGHGAHEALKTSKVTFSAIGSKGIMGILPVGEAISVMLGISADHSHECEGEQDQDEDHLAGREPELGFTKDTDSKDI